MTEPQLFLDGRVALHKGDCLEVVRTLADNSIDSVVTDPPYALSFMGKHWDTGETAFAVEFWAEVLRALKPGGHVAAFGGTRSYHRLACAIEDAGFEIRDQLAWTYGVGFPKSHDVSKGIDKAAGAEREVVGRKTGRAASPVCDIRGGRSVGGVSGAIDCSAITAPATADARQWEGWGTALKPAWETICLARKPLSEKTVAANILKWGVGALNIGGCRVEASDKTPAPVGQYGGSSIGANGHSGARNGSQDSLGRWPANLCHDGSDEVLAAFPVTHSAGSAQPKQDKWDDPDRKQPGWGNIGAGACGARIGDAGGSAARFFYSAKASKADRALSKHPTVKPVKLMQWLVRLITPPGGTVLDMFAGSGTTGEAAWREGFNAILIEREVEYQADIARRMAIVCGSPRDRAEASGKERAKVEGDLPLFAEAEG